MLQFPSPVKFCATCRASYPVDFATCPKDQTPLRLVTELPPGLVLRGKYEILAKIGAGGMGAVYKARHVAFGELRAIKFLGAHLLTDEGYLTRFRSEAVVARKLQHPNAVRVEDLDATDDGRPFIVMEYVDGRSLRDVMRDGPLGLPRALDLAGQACSALAAAHALGFVHRDIKPENIVLVEAPEGGEVLKILDFGLAKVRAGYDLGAAQFSTAAGLVIGTPQYMSPEQARDAEVDGRSDLYSLGVVLYEMVTGQLPFAGDKPMELALKHIGEHPTPPRQLGVPEPVSALVLRALAKDPAARFQSADEMKQAITRVAGLGLATVVRPVKPATEPLPTPGTAPMVKRPPTPRPARPTPRSTPVEREPEPAAPSSGSGWIWIGAAALVIALAFAVFGRRSPPPTSQGSTPTSLPAPAPAPPAQAAAPSDAAIQSEIEGLLFRSSALRDAHITVEVANGVVTLSGDVPSTTTSELATTLARSAGGVHQVFNTLAVSQAEPATAASEPSTEPSRPAPPTPPTPDPTREQVRALLDRARHEQEAGDLRAAEQDWEEVLRLEPANPVAREALERLRSRPPRPGGPPGRPPDPPSS